MKARDRTGEQKMNELAELRKRIAELETAEAERGKVEERTEHLNLVLRAIRNVSQLITRERGRDRLLKGACSTLTETRGYHNAWVALLDENGRLLTHAETGLGKDFLPMVELLKKGELTRCGRKALGRADVVVTQDPVSACADCPLSGKYAGRGAMTIRLEHSGGIYGLLSVSTPTEFAGDEEEQALLKELVGDVAFALHSIELEEERRKAEWEVRERVKELGCLYGVAEIIERPGIALDDVYRGVANLLPGSWQYPEIACARITIGDSEFKTENHRETRWRQSSDIKVHGDKVGRVEVCYLEERPESDEGPFLEEERRLLAAVAERLGRVTERKKTEEALRESEEQLRLTFDSVAEGVTVTDLEGKIADTNSAALRMHGYDSKEGLIGRSAFDLIAEREHSRAAENLKKTLEMGHSGTIEYSLLRKDGSEFPGQLSAALIKGATGEPRAFVAVTEDITERKKAERALLESEEFRGSLLDNSPAAVLVANEDTSIRYVNRALEERTGFSAAELVGVKAPYPFWPEESRAETEKSLRKAMVEGSHNVELQFQRKNGERFWAEISGTPVVREGKYLYYLSNWVDITERKRAEQALERSRDFSASLIASMRDGFSVLDPNGVHIDVNPALCSMTGFSREELVGSGPPHPYWPPEEYQRIEKAFNKTLKGEFDTLELAFVRKNGERFPVLVSPSQIEDKQGNAVSYFATIKDITERKQAEEALRKSEEEYRSLFEQSRDAIYVTTREGRFIDVNQSMLDLFGYTREELLETDARDIYVEPADRDRFQQEIEQKGSVLDYEVRFRKKDATPMDCLLTATLRHAEDGSIVGYQGIIRDISERKQAQEALESSRDELRRLATQLQLVREEERAAVAWELHDEVGQALAVLQIDLHWLERRLSRDDTELLEKAQSMSRLIQSNTERLRRLYMELRPGMLDDLGLAPTIEWQAEEFQKRTGIKSVLSLDKDAAPRGADCSLAVYRVFQEALSNVARHAEATEVNISLTKTDDRIVLEIADNGSGITREQASAPGSSGLVGMRELLRPWGGKVTITGVPGKGTTVRVSIPAGKGKQA